MKRALVFTILASAMLLFIPWLADPYVAPKFAPVLFAAAAILFMKSNRSLAPTAPTILFVAALIVCCAFSLDKYYSIIGTRLFMFDSGLAYLCYALVLMAAARSEVDAKEILSWVAWLSIPLSLYAIAQRVFGSPLTLFLNHLDTFASQRSISTQGGPVYLGALLAFIIPAVLYYATEYKKKPALIAVALAVVALFCSKTRGAYIAAIIGCFFLMENKKARASVVVAAIASIPFFPRIFSAASDGNRLETWKIAFRTFLENPLTGVGPGNFLLAFRHLVTDQFVVNAHYMRSAQSHGHNDILHFLAIGGVVGFIGYAVFLLGVSVATYYEPSKERKLLVALGMVYLFISKVNPVSNGPMILLAVLFGSVLWSEYDKPKDTRIHAAAAVLLGVISVQVCAGDYYYARAFLAMQNKGSSVQIAQDFETAANMNPWDIRIKAHQVDSLGALLSMAKPELRKQIGQTMVSRSVEALKMHPEDSFAHELYGKSLLVSAMVGNPENVRDAVIAFEIAQRLAPTFSPIMFRRNALARALGNKAILALSSKQIKRVTNLENLNRRLNHGA